LKGYMQDRIITAQLDDEEKRYEATLRPPSLSEYIGQEKVKENLNIFIEAAKRRSEALDHVLFYGPPGLGKTTLAYIISRELGGRETLPQYSQIFKKMRCSLLMRYTG